MEKSKVAILLCLMFLLLPWIHITRGGNLSNSVWVCISKNDQIKIFDSGTFTVKSTINITEGMSPWAITFTPNGGFAYVVCRESNNVVVLNTTTYDEIDVISVGEKPFGIQQSYDGKNLYVTNSGDDTISVIDVDAKSVVETIDVGGKPMNMAVSPDQSLLYVCLRDENQVAVLRLSDNTFLDPITVGKRPWGIALTPDGRKAYVSCEGDNEVWVIQLSDNTLLKKTGVNDNPRGIKVLPKGEQVYVAANEAVAIIDTSSNQKLDASGIHAHGWDLVITPENTYAFVTNGAHTGVEGVEVIDISKMEKIKTIFLGENTFGPRGIALQPVLSTGKILTTISCIAPGQIQENENIRIYGLINPPLEDKTISVTFIKPDNSEITQTVTSLPNGSYTLFYQPEIKGAWKAKASWEGDETYEPATSPTTSFKVGTSSIFGEGSFPIIVLAIIIIVVILGIRKILKRRKN